MEADKLSAEKKKATHRRQLTSALDSGLWKDSVLFMSLSPLRCSYLLGFWYMSQTFSLQPVHTFILLK